MLVPAIVYKDEIEKQFAKRMYDDDMFYYQGYAHGHGIPEIKAKDNYYQWAIVGYNLKDHWTNRVIGYFAYEILPDVDTVCNFGLYSFDKGNPLIGHDVFKKMEELIKEHHRVEWRCIEGNPANRAYKRFIKRMTEKYGVDATIATLTESTRDNRGRYHDEYIYQIVEV